MVRARIGGKLFEEIPVEELAQFDSSGLKLDDHLVVTTANSEYHLTVCDSHDGIHLVATLSNNLEFVPEHYLLGEAEDGPVGQQSFSRRIIQGLHLVLLIPHSTRVWVTSRVQHLEVNGEGIF